MDMRSQWKGLSKGETQLGPHLDRILLAALLTTDDREARVDAERPVRDSNNNPGEKQAV